MLRRMVGVGLGMILVFGGGCNDSQTRADGHPVDVPGKGEPEAVEKDEGLRESLLGMLGGYESGPSESALRGLGTVEAVVSGLLEVYGDESVHRHRRVQAFMSLRFFREDPRSVAAFEAALTDEATAASLRRRVVRAYGEMLGDEAVPLIARFLVHEDEHTREMARETLEALGTPLAREALCNADASCAEGGVQ
jgi:hypothetical protein